MIHSHTHLHRVACSAAHSVHGVSGSQAARPVRMMGALGAAWVSLGCRSAYKVGRVAAGTSRARAVP